MTSRAAPAAVSGLTEEQRRQSPGVFLMSDSFETGGSERQFSTLAMSLDRRAFRVSLGCIQKKGAFLDSLGDVGLGDVPVFPLGGSLYKLESWKTRARLARHLRQNAIDIAHAFDFYTNLTLIPAARWARVPVVIGSQRQLGDLLTRMQFQAQLFALRLADAVVCNSQAAADRLCAAGLPRHKTVVIGNGMPPEVFAPAEPAIPRVPGVLRIGMIARMNTRSKNHSSLLRAFAQLLKKMPNLELVLAGDGPFRAEIEREAQELGIVQNVRFLGDRRDVPAILASLDISVLPSVSESLSNSIIESMAQGIPVVAARVGGNVELVSEDRGTLVPAGDDSALVGALARLLKDEALRKNMGANARLFACENFTIGKMRQQLEDLYLRLLEGKISNRKLPGWRR
ncbi:MAG TPA: glycosyltransferase [Terriglobales bacterium]